MHKKNEIKSFIANNLPTEDPICANVCDIPNKRNSLISSVYLNASKNL